MVFSTVRFIHDWMCYLAFGIGVPLNAILIQMVVRHTPKQMQIYSKILLQTCICDIILLLSTLLFKNCSFTSQQGYAEAILTGLLVVTRVEDRGWALAGYVGWIFLVYISMFGYVSQFIYRYLILNWDKHLSPIAYFLLFAFILLFPLAYCIVLVFCYLPPAEQAMLDDPQVAQLLGYNLSTDHIVLAGLSTNGSLVTMAFYYIIALCTLAYVIMCTLAWLMNRLLRNRIKLGGGTAQTNKTIEMNKQITRNLVIQASLPFLIYLSMLFFLVIILFKLDVSSWAWLQHFNIFASIPMFLPSAINPVVSIAIIRYYRRTFVMAISSMAMAFRNLGYAFCCRSPPGSAPQEDRWARNTATVSTVKFSKNPVQQATPAEGQGIMLSLSR